MITVILHFGIHKTGSSTIQHSVKLDKNRDLLKSHSVYVFENLPANHSEMLITCFRDNPEQYHSHKRFGRTKEQVQRIKDNYLKIIKNEVKSEAQSKYFISGEDGCVMSEIELGRLRQFFEELHSDVKFHLVLCARNPLTYLKSAVQENVKGNNLTIEQAFEIHSKSSKDRYINLTSKLRRVFPDSELSLCSFESFITRDSSFTQNFFSRLLNIECELAEVKQNEAISDIDVLYRSYSLHTGITNQIPEVLLRDFSSYKINFLSASSYFSSDFLSEFYENARSDLDFLQRNYGVDYMLMENDLGLDLQGLLSEIRNKAYNEEDVDRFIDYYSS